MWPPRSLCPATQAVKLFNSNLVDRSKIILLPLHIKMDFMKNFVNEKDTGGDGFKYLRGTYLMPSDVIIKKLIFLARKLVDF